MATTATTPDINDYWRIYHSPEMLERADALRETHSITSTGVRIHIDVYPQASADAPVFIFNHGGGGYSRLFIPLALALHERGYTVVLPDQHGQGLSDGDRGDFTLGQCIQNVVDVSHWARERYTGKLILSGASFGSGITFNAAAAGAPADALICHNLYDLGDPRSALILSRFAFLTHIPGMARLSALNIRLLARVLPSLRIPFLWLGIFEHMVDDRHDGQFYPRWKADPYPIRAVSLRYLASVANTPPAHPLEANRLPILVINPMLDKMTTPEETRRNYERLGGEKQYVEIPYGHWALGDDFVQTWVSAVDDFVTRCTDCCNPPPDSAY